MDGQVTITPRTGRRRRIGWLGWIAITLGLLALTGTGLYLWTSRNGSVAMLDRVDGLFTKARSRVHVSYGPDQAQQLYIYPNRGKAPLPVLIFVHGGSWSSGDPADYGFVARNFAPRGFVVVLAGYRLGAKGRFPGMVEDTAAGVAWVHRHIGDYGGDPERIVLMGHSAGAYNAAMVALDRRWLQRAGIDPGVVKGVVGLAGPYDFYPFGSEMARNALGGWHTPEETQPATYARADAPPMLLLTGADDTVVKPRNTVSLTRALSAAGSPAEPLILPGIDHAGVLVALARPFDFNPEVKNAVFAFLTKIADSKAASAPVQPVDP
jgi:acetyl esterase/lipase